MESKISKLLISALLSLPALTLAQTSPHLWGFSFATTEQTVAARMKELVEKGLCTSPFAGYEFTTKSPTFKCEPINRTIAGFPFKVINFEVTFWKDKQNPHNLASI